jgi:hypothetical protein
MDYHRKDSFAGQVEQSENHQYDLNHSCRVVKPLTSRINAFFNQNSIPFSASLGCTLVGEGRRARIVNKVDNSV